ncbi:hypothetical protein A7A08_02821 [Methyloligella halotolerans]|uniref:Uncharacterized protein n=1 Tax=Methyloligella halotolerans TaxID=1177755 RepID=A0A1E2RW33_9HYPH|nr:hypothetical protein [Methyloligella halotolerans]ODA66423.1 hypothetical protein A7A08_02821 [Methyloligella halotolerans]
MSVKLFVPLFGIALIANVPAAAYDTLEQDFAICTQGQGSDPEIVDACTRLIDNAEVENEMVGMFYGLRASSNDDAAQNCSDANKVLELTDDPNLINAAQSLVEANC